MKRILILTYLLTATALSAATTADLLRKAQANLTADNLATADATFREALRAARVAKDRRSEAAARYGLACILSGPVWESRGNLQLALAIHRSLKDVKGEAADLARIGEIDVASGYYARALAPLADAAALQERLGLVAERAATLETLGLVLQNTGAYEDAASRLAAAVELRRRSPVATFERVRAEARLASLQSLLGLDESAAQHLQAARQAIREFRARFSEKRWNAMRDAWIAHGQSFLTDMGPMAEMMSKSLQNGSLEKPQDDVELLDIIGPDIETLMRGKGGPDDAPKLPDRTTDFFTTDKDEGRAADEFRSRWQSFLDAESEKSTSRQASGNAAVVAGLVDDVIAFNDQMRNRLDFDAPSDATWETEARDMTRWLRANHVNGTVTRETLVARAAARAAQEASSDAARQARRTMAANFVGMTDQMIHWMLEKTEATNKELLRQFTPAEVAAAHTIWSAEPCEMDIERNLQHVYTLAGNVDEARAANARAWALMDEQQTRFNKLLGVFGDEPASDVEKRWRIARDLGLPIPPVYTAPCDGVIAPSKATLWDADVYAAQHKPEDAVQRYEEAATGGPLMRATALSRIADLYDKAGNRKKAIEMYVQAIDAVEAVQGRLRLDDLVASWAGQEAPLYARAVELLREDGRADRAFEYAERARARAFLNHLGNRRLPRTVSPTLAAELHDVRAQLIALESTAPAAAPALPLPMPTGGAADPRAAEREALKKRYADLLARLAQSNPEYLSLVQVETLPVAKLQRDVLPLSTTLIEYFVLTDRTLAFVADRQTVRVVDLRIPATRVDERVAYFRNLVTKRRPEATEVATELYGILFAPIKALVRNSNLIIVPHASLHYLPFAALRDGTRKRYLLEDYAVVTAPSANALRFMKLAGTRSVSMLAIGDPDGTLPHAQAEAQAIAAMYGATPVVGAAATERRLRSEAPRTGFLHIAAHARYDAVQPLFSRIDLAKDGTQEDVDGELHLYEVYDLDLSASRLVVLSACDTALGRRSNGDEVVALARAFAAAGAPTVVTTLWSIDDGSTVAFMRTFYEHLRKGVPVEKAIQRAQADMLARYDMADWAPFVVFGRGG